MVKKVLYILLAILASTSFADTSNKSADKMVAKVNGQPVLESQVEDKIKKFLDFNGVSGDPKFSYNNLSSEMKKEIIKNIIENTRRDLIEVLASDIANEILNLDKVMKVSVNLHKPQAPVEVKVTDISVKITKTK